MYTPFLVHLLEHASDFQECAMNSHNRDQSYVWGWGRDKDLSAKQQENALQMSKAIKANDLIQKKDEQIYKQLKDKTIELQTKTRQDVTNHKGLSYTTQLLLEFDLFLTRLEVAFDYFQQNGLLNKNFKETPLIIFKSFLIFYLTNKAVHKRSLLIDYYKWTGIVKYFTYDEKLSTKKEILALMYLTKTYRDTTLSGIRAQITLLKDEDKKLVDTTTKIISVQRDNGFISGSAQFSFSLRTQNLTDTADAAYLTLPHAEATVIPSLPLSSLLREREEQNGSSSSPISGNINNDNDNDDVDEEEVYYSDEESTNKVIVKSV